MWEKHASIDLSLKGSFFLTSKICGFINFVRSNFIDLLLILFIEVLKSNPDVIHKNLSALGYEIFSMGMNSLAVHKEDPTLKNISTTENTISIK